MNADTAWDALDAALDHEAPGCSGLDLFTADRRTDEQRDLCASICARCPLLDPCDDYATTAKVDSGYWAGVERAVSRRATRTPDAGAVTPAPITNRKKTS
ncbi:WhiB family transcriptional regulator [Microbacterium sp. BH-3-3-3]|uniref:WhiB family transcriptional regulator n=1 Tax=Microbacterium sp. BH-3-3-3 TaxID=1906742 RepID=UPI0015E1A057|nr:WhiB family transcriptional regulator [Microbacterium sp. BH-3-3-3]